MATILNSEFSNQGMSSGASWQWVSSSSTRWHQTLGDCGRLVSVQDIITITVSGSDKAMIVGFSSR